MLKLVNIRFCSSLLSITMKVPWSYCAVGRLCSWVFR